MIDINTGVRFDGDQVSFLWGKTPDDLIKKTAPVVTKPEWDNGGIWLEWRNKKLNGIFFEKVNTSFGGSFKYPKKLCFLRCFFSEKGPRTEVEYTKAQKLLEKTFGKPLSIEREEGDARSTWNLEKVSLDHYSRFLYGGMHTLSISTI